MESPGPRYELIGVLARGKARTVHLALRRSRGAEEEVVAVKTVSAGVPPRVIAALRNEAAVLRWIRHPGVVEMRDFGQASDCWFLAVEYLDGPSLLEIVSAGREGKRLAARSTACLIARVAEALHAVHDLTDATGKTPLDLVHHDVSLSNIVVLYEGRPKLIDFGHTRPRSGTNSQTIEGKLGYMAPEKLRGGAGDRRSDVFSLGVVLWQALTLESLFQGSNADETITKVLARPILPPSQVNRDVPPALDEIVMSMLARDPNQRCASAGEVVVRLDQVLLEQDGNENVEQLAAYMTATFGSFRDARRRLIEAALRRH